MLLNCYQRWTFADPQAAICQLANLQPRFKSIFEAGPLIGRSSGKLFRPTF